MSETSTFLRPRREQDENALAVSSQWDLMISNPMAFWSVRDTGLAMACLRQCGAVSADVIKFRQSLPRPNAVDSGWSLRGYCGNHPIDFADHDALAAALAVSAIIDRPCVLNRYMASLDWHGSIRAYYMQGLLLMIQVVRSTPYSLAKFIKGAAASRRVREYQQNFGSSELVDLRAPQLRVRSLRTDRLNEAIRLYGSDRSYDVDYWLPFVADLCTHVPVRRF